MAGTPGSGVPPTGTAPDRTTYQAGPGLVVRFVFVGWWASALWMGAAWLIQLTTIGLPTALLMFDRTPFVASLYRY